MKSYDMQNPQKTTSREDTVSEDIVSKHKSAKDAALGKSKKPMEREDIEDEPDLDDIEFDDAESEDDDDADNDDGVLRDSRGIETKIDKPMWKTNERENKKREKKGLQNQPLDTTPSWQKPPSRMSSGGWLVTLTLLFIPVVNIILLFIWAFFSDSVPEEKKNFSRASIVLMTILIFVMLVIAVMFGKVSLSGVKDKASSSLSNTVNTMQDSLKDESQDAKDNYNGLTDDDFTNE